MTIIDTPSLITPRQFAKRIGVKKRRVYRWIERGYIRHIRLPGGQYLIPELEVERVLSGSAGRGQDGPQSGQGGGEPEVGTPQEASAGVPETGDSGAPA